MYFNEGTFIILFIIRIEYYISMYYNISTLKGEIILYKEMILMATAKIKIRKTLLILLCMILAYTCAGHSFLGPGLSQAATTLGTITATDVASPIGGQAEPMVDATAYKVSNVLVRITIRHNDVNSATF